LREYCKALGLREDVVKRLEDGMLGPLRHVRSSRFNTTGGIYDPGTQQMIAVESLSVEERYALHCRFEGKNRGFLDQAFELDLDYRLPSGRRVRTKTIVDITKFAPDGVLLVEGKPGDQGSINRLLQEHPVRWQLDGQGRLCSPPAEKAAAALGLQYWVFLSSDISDARHGNYLYFKDYVTSQTGPDLKTVSALQSVMKDIAYCHKSELLERGKDLFDVDDLHACIAWRHLLIDWDVPFRGHWDRLVFRDAQAFEAYRVGQKLGSPQKHAPVLDIGMLATGDTLAIDGEVLTVQLRTGTNLLMTTREGRSVDFRLIDIERMYGLHRISPLEIAAFQRPATVFAPAEGVKEALRRLALVDKMRAHCLPEGIETDRTIRTWAAQRDAAISAGSAPVDAVTPKTCRRGWRGSHLTEDVEERLKKFLVEHVPDTTDRSATSLYATYKDDVIEEGGSPVSLPTFRDRHEKRLAEKLAEQQGEREAYQQQPFAERLDYEMPVHGSHAFSVVHIDHTPLSQELVSFLTGVKLGCPWLSLAMCAFTRRILAFLLSFRAPSARTLCALLIDMVRRYGRLPSTLVNDGGPEFDSIAWNRIKQRFVSDFRERTKKPRGGSVMERMLGTTEEQIAKQTAGNTKSRKRGRLNTALIDASSHAGQSLIEAYATYEEYFFDIHDNKIHAADKMSPRTAFERSLALDGARRSRLVTYDQGFLVGAALEVDGLTRVVNRRTGVRDAHYDFTNREVQERIWSKGKRPVREDVFDPSTRYVEFEGTWAPFRCEAIGLPMTDGDPVVQRVLGEELFKLQKLHDLSAQEAALKVGRLVKASHEQARKRRESGSSAADDAALGHVQPAAQPQAKTVSDMFRIAQNDDGNSTARRRHIDE
jgi:putative transposase